MKNMFNKSVIAVALLGTFAVTAGEVDFSATPAAFDATVLNVGNDGAAPGTLAGAVLLSKELLDNASTTAQKTLTRTITGGAGALVGEYGQRFINYVSPVDLKEKSTLVFKFEGGAVAATPTLALFRANGANLQKVGSLTDFVADTSGNYTTAKFQLDAGIAGAQVNANQTLVIGVSADDAGLLADVTKPTLVVADGATSMTVSVPEVRDDNAQLLNAPIAGAETLVVVASQFKTTVTKNNDKIDVNQLRKGFTAATPNDANDATSIANIVVAENTNFGVAGNVVFPVATTAALTLTGTQAAIDTINDGAALVYTASTNTWARSVAGSALSAYAGAGLNVTATVKTGTAAVAIEEAVYPGTLAVAAYAGTAALGSTVKFNLFKDTTVLDWKLNAATATIPYMPMGSKGTPSDTQQVIYVTNKGTSAGAIFVDVWTEDGTKVLSAEKVGDTVKNGITKIGSAIKTLLDNKDIANQKVTIKVVAEVPQKEFEVFSAFTVNGNRQLVINDSNVTSSRNVGL